MPCDNLDVCSVFLFCFCANLCIVASWPRRYLRVWTLLCSKSPAVSPILHSNNNNISESPGINKARATLWHRNPFNDSSLITRKSESYSVGLLWLIRELSSPGYRCVNLWPASCSCVPCTLLSRLNLIPVFYICGVYIMHQGELQCRQLSHGCTQVTLEDYEKEDVCCFVNIHGPEYFVSQQLQMILSMPHLDVYIDIEWSENVNTHPNCIRAYLTNIGSTMFWQCPLLSCLPHP